MDERVYVVRKRVLRQPKGKDKADSLRYALGRKRKQRHKWPEPADATLILNLHFTVHSFRRQSFHADATLEIPVKEGYQYFSVSKGSTTEADALRGVIVEIQNSVWFRHMKERGVYFRVTGVLEELYRGWL